MTTVTTGDSDDQYGSQRHAAIPVPSLAKQPRESKSPQFIINMYLPTLRAFGSSRNHGVATKTCMKKAQGSWLLLSPSLRGLKAGSL